MEPGYTDLLLLVAALKGVYGLLFSSPGQALLHEPLRLAQLLACAVLRCCTQQHGVVC
jgi:hypothetical protein